MSAPRFWWKDDLSKDIVKTLAAFLGLLVLGTAAGYLDGRADGRRDALRMPSLAGYHIEQRGNQGEVECEDGKHEATSEVWAYEDQLHAVRKVAVVWTYDGRRLAVVFVNHVEDVYADPDFDGLWNLWLHGEQAGKGSVTDLYRLIDACHDLGGFR